MRAIEAKIVVLGAQGVGKTSMVSKYISNVCSKEVSPTIGASFFTCKINLNNVKCKMQIWDTAGQERFRAMAPMYYRNANAALLVFDISHHNSFEEIKGWIQELQRNVQEQMVLTLVGNKTDLEETRTVSREEAYLYAASIGATYIETSAIKDQGIEQVFVATALGLIRLSSENGNSSIRRYESTDSILNSNGYSSIQLGIPVETDVEVNGIGRLERASWSIDHIAHGDEHKTGWCCY